MRTQQGGLRRGSEKVGRPGECHDVEAKKIYCFMGSGVRLCQKLLEGENGGHRDAEICALTTLSVEDGFQY